MKKENRFIKRFLTKRKNLFLSIISVLTFFFISCEENSLDYTSVINPEPTEVGEKEKAIEAFYNFLEHLNSDPQTRSTVGNQKIAAIKKTSTSNYSGISKTRTEVSGLPLFEFTLENPDHTNGFALITGEEEINEVIAYIPYGSISDTIYNEGLALYFRELATLTQDVSARSSALFDPKQSGWEEVLFDPYYYQENFDRSTQQYVRELTAWEIKTYAHTYSWIFYDPIDQIKITSAFVPTRWDQTNPYNNKVPYYVTGTSTRVRVGCFPLAVGQIMAYHKYPKTYNWTLLTSQEKITASHAGANEVGRLLYDIALASKTEYSTAKPAGSGKTYSQNYISGINKMGYSAKEIYFGTSGGSIPVIKEEIRINDSPVIYCAQSTNVGAGHGWVVDGVMTMERWKYISGFTNTGKYPLYRYRATGSLIHCNWGWGGESDGWFYNLKVQNSQHGLIYFDYGKSIITNIKPQ